MRCREDGVQRARMRATADSVKAKTLANVLRDAKLLSGWVTQKCRHTAHCQPGTPPPQVEQLYNQQQGIRPPVDPSVGEATHIFALARRMEAVASEAKHRQAAEAYDDEKVAREERELEAAERQQEANAKERVDKARAAQKAYWDRQWRDGLRPVATHPGAPIDDDDYANLFGGRWQCPSLASLRGFGINAVRAGMDAFSKPGMVYDQQLKLFFSIAGRVQRGLGVSWMSQQDIERDGLTPLDWDDKRGPFYSQGNAEESDLHVEMYDGGESAKWKAKQREAERQWRSKQPGKQTKTDDMLSELLGGIGRQRD